MDEGPLLDDLAAEHAALDALVAPLEVAQWDQRTPPGAWRIRDQIGHLAFFDAEGSLAAADPEAFTAERDADFADLEGFAERSGRLAADHTGPELLTAWRGARSRCLAALAAVPAGARLPWYGPSMSVRSFTTARLMETWAHGQDVVDGLAAAGVPAKRAPTDRLRHLCHLGWSTRAWSYTVRGVEPPGEPVRVELTLPSGARWTAGDDDAASIVRGLAEDFCLVVTQRRNVADTALDVVGDAASSWMAVAQCFAGPPTVPPAPGSRIDRPGV